MISVRLVVRCILEAYRQILSSKTSFSMLLVWTIVIYAIVGLSAIHRADMGRITASLESTDIFVLIDRDVAGVATIGDRLRKIPGVRRAEFVFPERDISVQEVSQEDLSSGPFVFFHLRTSVVEDTLMSVMEHARSIAGVYDVLESDLQTRNLRVFLESVQFGYMPVYTAVIGLCIGILIIISWIDVFRFTSTMEVMRALGASRSYTSMPCAIISGIRGFLGILVSIPVIEIAFRFGFFDLREPGESVGFGFPVGLVTTMGIVIPAVCSFGIAWVHSSFVFRRS